MVGTRKLDNVMRFSMLASTLLTTETEAESCTTDQTKRQSENM